MEKSDLGLGWLENDTPILANIPWSPAESLWDQGMANVAVVCYFLVSNKQFILILSSWRFSLLSYCCRFFLDAISLHHCTRHFFPGSFPCSLFPLVSFFHSPLRFLISFRLFSFNRFLRGFYCYYSCAFSLCRATPLSETMLWVLDALGIIHMSGNWRAHDRRTSYGRTGRRKCGLECSRKRASNKGQGVIKSQSTSGNSFGRGNQRHSVWTSYFLCRIENKVDFITATLQSLSFVFLFVVGLADMLWGSRSKEFCTSRVAFSTFHRAN